jgi:hypothetical protein
LTNVQGIYPKQRANEQDHELQCVNSDAWNKIRDLIEGRALFELFYGLCGGLKLLIIARHINERELFDITE